jgi:hypothetical protein
VRGSPRVSICWLCPVVFWCVCKVDGATRCIDPDHCPSHHMIQQTNTQDASAQFSATGFPSSHKSESNDLPICRRDSQREVGEFRCWLWAHFCPSVSFINICRHVPIGQQHRTLHVKTYARLCAHLQRNSLNTYQREKCFVHATSRKISGLIPDEVIGYFNWPNPSSRTMALGSTQPLTEMSTRNLYRGKGRPAREPNNLTAICEPIF